MAEPTRRVVVGGTGTEIGKTHVACALATTLVSRGLTVGARKPAQSFDPGSDPTDADLLGAATGEAPEVVCPPHRCYARAMAPPMAAEVLGAPPVHLADLLGELTWPPGSDVVLFESAGGLRSPIALDGDTLDLAAGLRADVLVVIADAGLGTINAVRQAAELTDRHVPDPHLVVHLNRFDDVDELHRANLAWLRAREGLAPTTTVAALTDAVLG